MLYDIRDALKREVGRLTLYLGLLPEDDEDEDEDEEEVQSLDAYTAMLFILLIIGNVLSYSAFIRLAW